MERALGAIAPRWSSSGRVETMMTCDYNGWNDAPEDEREWFDQHPEIWAGPREVDRRPGRVTPKHPPRVRRAA
jgi:hypothetical protein